MKRSPSPASQKGQGWGNSLVEELQTYTADSLYTIELAGFGCQDGLVGDVEFLAILKNILFGSLLLFCSIHLWRLLIKLVGLVELLQADSI